MIYSEVVELGPSQQTGERKSQRLVLRASKVHAHTVSIRFLRLVQRPGIARNVDIAARSA